MALHLPQFLFLLVVGACALQQTEVAQTVTHGQQGSAGEVLSQRVDDVVAGNVATLGVLSSLKCAGQQTQRAVLNGTNQHVGRSLTEGKDAFEDCVGRLTGNSVVVCAEFNDQICDGVVIAVGGLSSLSDGLGAGLVLQLLAGLRPCGAVGCDVAGQSVTVGEGTEHGIAEGAIFHHPLGTLAVALQNGGLEDALTITDFSGDIGLIVLILTTGGDNILDQLEVLLGGLQSLGVSLHTGGTLLQMVGHHSLQQTGEGLLQHTGGSHQHVTTEVTHTGSQVAQHSGVAPCTELITQSDGHLVCDALEDAFIHEVALLVSLGQQILLSQQLVDHDFGLTGQLLGQGLSQTQLGLQPFLQSGGNLGIVTELLLDGLLGGQPCLLVVLDVLSHVLQTLHLGALGSYAQRGFGLSQLPGVLVQVFQDGVADRVDLGLLLAVDQSGQLIGQQTTDSLHPILHRNIGVREHLIVDLINGSHDLVQLGFGGHLLKDVGCLKCLTGVSQQLGVVGHQPDVSLAVHVGVTGVVQQGSAHCDQIGVNLTGADIGSPVNQRCLETVLADFSAGFVHLDPVCGGDVGHNAVDDSLCDSGQSFLGSSLSAHGGQRSLTYLIVRSGTLGHLGGTVVLTGLLNVAVLIHQVCVRIEAQSGGTVVLATDDPTDHVVVGLRGRSLRLIGSTAGLVKGFIGSGNQLSGSAFAVDGVVLGLELLVLIGQIEHRLALVQHGVAHSRSDGDGPCLVTRLQVVNLALSILNLLVYELTLAVIGCELQLILPLSHLLAELGKAPLIGMATDVDLFNLSSPLLTILVQELGNVLIVLDAVALCIIAAPAFLLHPAGSPRQMSVAVLGSLAQQLLQDELVVGLAEGSLGDTLVALTGFPLDVEMCKCNLFELLIKLDESLELFLSQLDLAAFLHSKGVTAVDDELGSVDVGLLFGQLFAPALVSDHDSGGHFVTDAAQNRIGVDGFLQRIALLLQRSQLGEQLLTQLSDAGFLLQRDTPVGAALALQSVQLVLQLNDLGVGITDLVALVMPVRLNFLNKEDLLTGSLEVLHTGVSQNVGFAPVYLHRLVGVAGVAVGHLIEVLAVVLTSLGLVVVPAGLVLNCAVLIDQEDLNVLSLSFIEDHVVPDLHIVDVNIRGQHFIGAIPNIG